MTARQETTRAEISRSRLLENFEHLGSMARAIGAGNCELMAVVKGNAYGNGVALCAPWLAAAGAEWLGVTSAEEGAAVRRLCPSSKILVMRCLLRGEADQVVAESLTPTVWDPAQLGWLAAAARQQKPGAAGVPIHLEIDSGMARQGAAAGDLGDFLKKLKQLPDLRLDGVYTHFASPEMLDSDQNPQQWAAFERAVETIYAAGFSPKWIHAGNSNSVLSGRVARPLAVLAKKLGARCMMRPGIALYGYASAFTGSHAADAEAARAGLKPVLTWKTEIASVRTVRTGTKIGYDATFTANRQMTLALLPVGYADGLNRKLSGGGESNGGHVLVRGTVAPIVGRVSMDLTVVDVSNASGAGAGDEVILIGEQGKRRITADDHARWAETIPYEILCGIAARVPRVASE
jgi:alanine racemase